MAKGNLLTMSSLQGSIGGLTFKATSNGSVMSGKRVPRKSLSIKQSQNRIYVCAYAGRWRTLTSAQRSQWRRQKYAGLTGFQLYMYCNLNNRAVSDTGFIDQMRIPSFPLNSNMQIAASSADSVIVTYHITNPPQTNYRMEFQATSNLSDGVGIVSASRYKTVFVRASATSGSSDVSTAYVALYGSLSHASGRKVFFRMRLVDKMSGCASPWIKAATIVT